MTVQTCSIVRFAAFVYGCLVPVRVPTIHMYTGLHPTKEEFQKKKKSEKFHNLQKDCLSFKKYLRGTQRTAFSQHKAIFYFNLWLHAEGIRTTRWERQAVARAKGYSSFFELAINSWSWGCGLGFYPSDLPKKEEEKGEEPLCCFCDAYPSSFCGCCCPSSRHRLMERSRRWRSFATLPFPLQDSGPQCCVHGPQLLRTPRLPPFFV